MTFKWNPRGPAPLAVMLLAIANGWRVLLAIAVFLVGPGQAHGTPGNFVYDAGGRLVQVIGASGNSTRYVYDAAGNLLSVTPLSATTPAVTGFSK